MKRYIVCALILGLSAVCVSTQTVDGPHYLLDYRFLAPVAQLLHRGQLYVSYYDRGGVVVFDSTLNTASSVVELEKLRVSHLFHHRGVLLAVATDGSVHFYNDSSQHWYEVGVFDCVPFVGDDGLFVLSGETISQYQIENASWTSTVVGKIPSGSGEVNAFVVTRDRIVYSVRDSKTIFVASLDGMLVRSTQSLNTVDGLTLLNDGSIAISSSYSISKVLRADSIVSGGISSLYYNSSLLNLTNASNIQASTTHGLVGTFSLYGSDPREGIYIVVNPDSIVKRIDLDTIVEDVVRVTMQDDRTVLTAYGHLCVVDRTGAITRARWNQDTTLASSNGISFTTLGTPFLCGSAKINGVTFPAKYPTNNSYPLEILPITDKDAGLMIRYVHLDGGPEVAFCSYGIFTKNGSDSWVKVYSSKADLISRHIDVVNDSTIVCRSPGRMILLSTDKGSTWRTVTIKDYLWQMTPVISAGTSLYAHSQGDVWALDMEDPSDSVAPPHIHVAQGPHQRLFACNPNEVQIVSARSDTDPNYQPEYYTHLVCHRWNPSIQRLDSTSHSLDKLLQSDGLTVIVRKDTAYFWNAVNRRMLAVKYEGVIFDTILDSKLFSPFTDQPLSTVVYDNIGTPWLFASGLVTGFKLDPSSSIVTSVDDYYDYMYVGAIRPNPAKDNVSVTLGRFPAAVEANVQFYLVNMQGTVVRNFTNNVSRFSGPQSTQTVDISVDGLPWGVYLIVIENLQGKSAGKLIVTP